MAIWNAKIEFDKENYSGALLLVDQTLWDCPQYTDALEFRKEILRAIEERKLKTPPAPEPPPYSSLPCGGFVYAADLVL